MRRRQLLAALPVASGFAGCVSGPGVSDENSQDSDTTTAATDAESSPESTSPTADRSPPPVAFRSALRYAVNDDAIGVEAPDEDQFAFVRPSGDGDDPPPDAFTLELDDRRFSPRSSVPGFALQTPGVDSAYTTDRRSGWLAFDVPTVEAMSGALVRGETRYALADDGVSTFATAPDFGLRSVSVPDSVSPREPVTVTMDVANDGGRDGTFLAGVHGNGRFDPVDVSVGAGETATRTHRLQTFGGSSDTTYFAFEYAGGTERYEVPVESDE